MVEDPGAEVVRGAPYLDELLTFTEFYTHHGYSRFFGLRFFSQGYKLITTLLKKRYDIFIELQSLFNWKGIIKPMLIGYLSRAPLRIGLNTDRRGLFLTTKVPDTRLTCKSMMERTLEVVKKLGVETNDLTTEVWISEKDRSYARYFLDKHQIKHDDLLIGIHPGGNPEYLIRCSWPEERFSQVADTLVEKYRAKILLTGGPQEVEYVKGVASLMKTQPLMQVGKTTVKQLAAIMERCHLFISNDTGPMHMAVAMQTPTIGIFGPGEWQMYGTYPPETNFIMLRKPIDCWPCQNLKCTTRACFKLISVEDVLEAVEKQMTKIRQTK
jgi:heptosyltransferase-2